MPISPEDGICGTVEWVQEVNSKNCCDDPSATLIVYDEDRSVDIIGDNSYGVIQYDGGLLPATVTLHGNGFYTDPYFTKTSIEVTGGGRQVGIYTKDACGSCSITIDDGCSTASGTVKSTAGQWVYVQSHDVLSNPSCCPQTDGTWDGYSFATSISKDKKWRQQVAIIGLLFSSDYCVACLAPGETTPCPSCPSDYGQYYNATVPDPCSYDYPGAVGPYSTHAKVLFNVSEWTPTLYEDNCGATTSTSCNPRHPVCEPDCRCFAGVQVKQWSNLVQEWEWRC